VRRLVAALGLAVVAWLGACGGPTVEDRCALPGDGCPCAAEGQTVACGEVVAQGVSDLTCRTGKRSCGGGVWSACAGSAFHVESYPKLTTRATASAPCAANPCDPGCMSFDDTALDIPSAPRADGGGITLGESGTGADGAAGGPTCTGHECKIDACGGDYLKSQISGKVYDPAGKNPIYNVLVYIPNASLPALVDKLSCDSCTGAAGSPIVSALTDSTGSFTLKGVPSGLNIPLVIQSGKWRRKLTIPKVTACAGNDLSTLSGTDGLPLVRFPKNRVEGDIPRIAFVSGGADPFQCVLSKMGLDVSAATGEVGKDVLSGGAANPDRIHYYQSTKSPGHDLSGTLGGPAQTAASLWGSAASLDRYDAIILACEGGDYDKGVDVNGRIADWVGRGGRLFATHFSYSYLQYAPAASDWPKVVQAWNHSGSYSDPMTTLVNRTFPKGDAFARWLSAVGASPTLGLLAISEGRRDYDYVDRTRATAWMMANQDGSAPTAGLPAGGACTDGASCASGVCSGASSTTTGLTNAGFESALTGWSTSGGKVAATSGGRTGNALLLGSSSPGATNQVTQSFTAPAAGGALSLYYKVSCTDVGYDYAWAKLRNDTTGVTVTVLGNTCTSTGLWQNATTPLTALQSYTLTLGMTEYPDAVAPSSVMFDDVSFVTSGTCTTAAACTKDADCPGGTGKGCWNGACVPAHQMEPLLTFNAPIGAAPAAQCGRVVYSDFHVSASALQAGSTFPESCKPGDLSAQEKALEFMLFDLTSCLTPDYVPPASPTYTALTVTRDYAATCPLGSRAVWHYFDWKTITPGDSKISFTVQTGDTTAKLTAMTALPLATVLGASVTSFAGADVAAVLKTAGVPHGGQLRVTITLTPSTGGALAPTLVDWQQAYSCVPME